MFNISQGIGLGAVLYYFLPTTGGRPTEASSIMHATEYDVRRHDCSACDRLRIARQATSKTNAWIMQAALVAVAVLALLPA